MSVACGPVLTPEGLHDLRDSCAAEMKRLEKRPVPTTPWIMPAGPDDIAALVDVFEAARDYLSALDAEGIADDNGLRAALGVFDDRRVEGGDVGR